MINLKRFLKNKKAVGGVIYVMLSLMITLLVAILVVNALVNSQTPDSTWSVKANTTWASVQSYIWMGIGLAAIGIIILAAMAILSYMSPGKQGF